MFLNAAGKRYDEERRADGSEFEFRRCGVINIV